MLRKPVEFPSMFHMSHPKVDLHGTAARPWKNSMIFFDGTTLNLSQITREDFHNIKHGEVDGRSFSFPKFGDL